MSEDKRYILSFSGGKDSTAMLHLVLQAKLPLDEIVFFDTGWEFPEMYEHIKLVESKIGKTITKLKQPMSFEYYLKDVEIKTGKYAGMKGYGWPWAKGRWCTHFKIDIIKKHAGKSYQYIGIAADETRRIHGEENRLYPLVDANMKEQQALEYCYSLGYNWGGLYEKIDRVSCFCCPLQRVGHLKMLYNDRPELWAHMKSIDRISTVYNTTSLFKGRTLSEWESRFDSENNKEKM